MFITNQEKKHRESSSSSDSRNSNSRNSDSRNSDSRNSDSSNNNSNGNMISPGNTTPISNISNSGNVTHHKKKRRLIIIAITLGVILILGIIVILAVSRKSGSVEEKKKGRESKKKHKRGAMEISEEVQSEEVQSEEYIIPERESDKKYEEISERERDLIPEKKYEEISDLIPEKTSDLIPEKMISPDSKPTDLSYFSRVPVTASYRNILSLVNLEGRQSGDISPLWKIIEEENLDEIMGYEYAESTNTKEDSTREVSSKISSKISKEMSSSITCIPETIVHNGIRFDATRTYDKIKEEYIESRIEIWRVVNELLEKTEEYQGIENQGIKNQGARSTALKKDIDSLKNQVGVLSEHSAVLFKSYLSFMSIYNAGKLDTANIQISNNMVERALRRLQRLKWKYEIELAKKVGLNYLGGELTKEEHERIKGLYASTSDNKTRDIKTSDSKDGNIKNGNITTSYISGKSIKNKARTLLGNLRNFTRRLQGKSVDSEHSIYANNTLNDPIISVELDILVVFNEVVLMGYNTHYWKLRMINEIISEKTKRPDALIKEMERKFSRMSKKRGMIYSMNFYYKIFNTAEKKKREMEEEYIKKYKERYFYTKETKENPDINIGKKSDNIGKKSGFVMDRMSKRDFKKETNKSVMERNLEIINRHLEETKEEKAKVTDLYQRLIKEAENIRGKPITALDSVVHRETQRDNFNLSVSELTSLGSIPLLAPKSMIEKFTNYASAHFSGSVVGNQKRNNLNIHLAKKFKENFGNKESGEVKSIEKIVEPEKQTDEINEGKST